MNRRAVVSIRIPFSASRTLCAIEGPLVAGSQTKHRYMQALEKECASALSLLADYEVRAIRVEGGSPSAVRPDDVARLLRFFRKNLNLSKSFEVSMELLPQTAGTPCMDGMKGGGVNRILLQIPSALDEDLERLGCGFGFDDIQNALAFIGRFCFKDLTVNTCYGISGQDERSFVQSLKMIASCEPETIRLAPYPGVDAAGDACGLASAQEVLEKAGYARWSDDLFTKPRYTPRYESALREGVDVFGFGLGAVSRMERVLCTNTEDLNVYLASEGSYGKIVAKVEELPATDAGTALAPIIAE